VKAAIRGLVTGGLEICGLLPLLRRQPDPGRAVILRYHSVSEPRADNDLYRSPSISIAPGTFERQMRFLAARYEVVPLGLLAECLAAGRPFPPRAVAITFDDGYRDNYLHALPCLRELALPATIFATAGSIGNGWGFWVSRVRAIILRARSSELEHAELGRMDLRTPAAREGWIEFLTREICGMAPSEADAELARLSSLAGVEESFTGGRGWMMTWDELRETAAAGIEIGAHTVHHPVLTQRSDEEAAAEISESRRILEEGLGRPVLHFAYPNAPWVRNQDERVARLVRQAGFLSASTSEEGPVRSGDDLYRLPRLAVAERDAVRGLAFNLERDRIPGAPANRGRRRPRLVMVGPPPDARTGIATCVRNILRSDLPCRFEIIHISPTGRHGHYAIGTTRKLLELARGSLIFAAAVLRRRPAAVQVHSSHYGDFWRNSPFILGAWSLRLPTVFICHGSRFDAFFREAGPVKKRLIRFLLRRPRAILVRGRYWKDFFSSSIVPGARVEVLPTTADPVEGSFHGRNPGSDPVVLYVGGNPQEEDARRKGLPDLLEAVPDVLSRIPRARFRIVGPALDSSSKESLRGPSAERVEFVGTLPPEEVSRQYRSATIFVLPSRAEGMPNVVLEAMAHGLPVVATDVGSVSEILETEAGGYIVPPRDRVRLADALVGLLEDPGRARAMGEHNLERIRSGYTNASTARRLIRLYLSLLGPSLGRR